MGVQLLVPCGRHRGRKCRSAVGETLFGIIADVGSESGKTQSQPATRIRD